MWLKSYFNLSNDRALWGKIADAIFAGPKATPGEQGNIDPRVKRSYFEQSWETKITALPESLKKLLQMARSVNMRLESWNPSKEIKRSRQIWFHGDASPRLRLLNNSRAAHCLKERHGLLTVGQAEDLANHLEKHEHFPWDECECEHCVKAEELGCKHPHTCFSKAKELLDMLTPKWDPRKSDLEESEDDLVTSKNWNEIDTRITTHGTLGDVARIFMEGPTSKSLVPPAHKDRCQPDESPVMVIVGGVDNKRGEVEARSGAGLLIKRPEGIEEKSFRTPERYGNSAPAGELYGVLKAIEETEPDQPLNIEVQTKATVELLMKKIPDLEDRGYTGIPNRKIIQKVLASVRSRKH
ncbi:hypothetical protein BT96DRAFT_824151 [Gymnopus androsaceus JB14]|uniref:RNase H type-1 domain-containing protein n=1 Tax=Gymnopus androsaceus JB14 TaxID=1447944 RepID=A0A6A4HGA4_9AGAR|nr:hypothetical protein BT96DRAFT_824151 [Gymnopus androsaceus JB14]